jgi:hypothetical protein
MPRTQLRSILQSDVFFANLLKRKLRRRTPDKNQHERPEKHPARSRKIPTWSLTQIPPLPSFAHASTTLNNGTPITTIFSARPQLYTPDKPQRLTRQTIRPRVRNREARSRPRPHLGIPNRIPRERRHWSGEEWVGWGGRGAFTSGCRGGPVATSSSSGARGVFFLLPGEREEGLGFLGRPFETEGSWWFDWFGDGAATAAAWAELEVIWTRPRSPLRVPRALAADGPARPAGGRWRVGDLSTWWP